MRLLALPLLLAGCASLPAGAPSLLPRANEGGSFAEPHRPAPQATPDASLDAEIARRGAAVDTATAAFLRAADAAEPRLARGGRSPAGSDAWIDAQAAVAELGQGYAAADAAMADLVELAIERAAAGRTPYPALDARVAAAQAALDRATMRLNALKALVGEPG